MGDRLLGVLSALVARLPWTSLRLLGAAIGWVAGTALRIRRRHVERAMRIAGVPEPPAAARAMYASLGTSVFELVWSARRGPEALAHVSIDEASASAWREAARGGRGVVIAASHTGNWDLAASAMARHAELLVITKHLSVGWLDRFWQSTRAAAGVQLGDATGALARARDFLRRGGAVAMMIDQVPERRRHAVAVDFLGRRAYVDRAPAALAAASGAPIVVAAARRSGVGRQVLYVLKVIVPPSRPSRAWIAEATASATRALDEFVRAHPSEWLWMHRRWKLPERTATESPVRPEVDRNARAATLARPWRKIPSSSPGANSRAG